VVAPLSEEGLKRLAKDIDAGRLLPVYLFEGPEEFRKLRALDALKKAVVGESPADMAFERFDGLPAAYVCDRARTAPFFVERRLLVAGGAEKYGDADVAALTAYLADPSPNAVIVLWVDGKLDRRKKFYKFCDKSGCVFTFEYLTGPARRKRLEAEAARLGVKLSAEAAAYLDYALAPDLFIIVRELEKLAAYGAGEELSAEEVAEVAAASRVENVYEMVRNVGEGNLAPALVALRRLLLSGERPESMIGLFARQIRLIWLAGELREAGLNAAETASRLKVPAFYVNEYLSAAERLDRPRLAQLHRLLAELDRGVKTGRVPAVLALELFAARAAGP
jgi:DNA polymerase-3 subunit delta